MFIATVVLLASWTVLTAYESLAPNALSGRGPAAVSLRNALVTIAPQRWEFFTASPQGSQVAVYNAATFDSAMRFPQTKSANAFGLTRTQRAQGPEMAILSAAVRHWDRCETPGNSRACLESARHAKAQEVVNTVRYPSLCGTYVIAIQRPTPFEFRHFGYGDTAIQKTAEVRVLCS